MGVKWFVYKKHLIKDKIILKDRIQIKKKLKTKLDYEGVSPIVLVKNVRTPWCESKASKFPAQSPRQLCFWGNIGNDSQSNFLQMFGTNCKWPNE